MKEKTILSLFAFAIALYIFDFIKIVDLLVGGLLLIVSIVIIYFAYHGISFLRRYYKVRGLKELLLYMLYAYGMGALVLGIGIIVLSALMTDGEVFAVGMSLCASSLIPLAFFMLYDINKSIVQTISIIVMVLSSLFLLMLLVVGFSQPFETKVTLSIFLISWATLYFNKKKQL